MAKLGKQAVGSIVKLNVNGTAANFIVVQQGLPGTMYDASCDGTWLLMEKLYKSKEWDSTANDYANSDIHDYLNNTFINLFDDGIKSVIKQAKIPYTKNGGRYGVVADGTSGLSTKIFLLSNMEVGFSGEKFHNIEGAVLEYFNGADDSKRAAMLGYSKSRWWTRSTYASSYDSAIGVYLTGSPSYYDVIESHGVRPALILPGKCGVADNGLIDGTIASGGIRGGVTIGGVQRELTGEGYININGVLREITDSQVNIGGVLKSTGG